MIMGLYDARLAELSEHRQLRSVAARSPYSSLRSIARAPTLSAARKSMRVQSLLFDRKVWTESKAKSWAKANGYRYGKVDVTDQYIRIRQFDPKGSKVKRTIPFGRGIRAVVAREETKEATMRTAKEAPRRRRRSAPKKKKSAPKRRAHRRARKTVTTEARRSHKRRRKARVVATKRKTHRRRRHTASAGYVMAPRRRHVSREAWRGDGEGHAKAARKGWRRKKRKAAAPKRRRRRRRRTAEATRVMEAPRRRRRHNRRYVRSMFEAPRRGGGMSGLQFGMAVISGGFGFVAADAIDRLLATYNPSSTDAKPTDRFTSDGAGTLANTLNVAAMPNWKRLVAGGAVVLVPAVGSMAVDHPVLKSSLEGMAFGAGISLFKTLWNNVLMPLLVGKDTSTPALQKSYIARLYPAEVAAHINQAAQQTAVSSSGSGALSGQEAGVADQDVGPFALSGESPYPDAAQALRAGVSDLPTVQNTMGTGAGNLPTVQQHMGTGGPGGNFPTVAQHMGTGAPYASGNPGQPGVSADDQPGPPSVQNPGPQARPHQDPACGCMGDGEQFAGYLGDAPSDDGSPFLASVT